MKYHEGTQDKAEIERKADKWLDEVSSTLREDFVAADSIDGSSSLLFELRRGIALNEGVQGILAKLQDRREAFLAETGQDIGVEQLAVMDLTLSPDILHPPMERVDSL